VQETLGTDAADCSDTRREVHGALQKALFDYERQQYNTVVSACMTIANALNKLDDSPAALAMLREGMGILLRLLSPIAPHVSHEMWRALGFGDDIHHAGWPAVDESALRSDTIEYVVQVNGKMRGKIEVAADAPRSEVEEAAFGNENVRRFTDGLTVRKTIVVPNKLVNIVAK
jgi:leucyl-tRNA synthetase